jgi:hypothetical protein
VPIDTALVGALYVDYIGRRNLAKDDPLYHTLFQTSTIDALLDGKYDGDVSFAELAERGDFGLGTLDALDGEMVALDGSFYKIGADGRVHPVDRRTRTPFTVVTVFEPGLSRILDATTDLAALCARVDRLLERVMDSIRKGLGIGEREIGREPSRPCNPHFYAVFAQVHKTL